MVRDEFDGEDTFFGLVDGFDKVVKRAGRRVLIDEQAFFEWVEEQNGNGR